MSRAKHRRHGGVGHRAGSFAARERAAADEEAARALYDARREIVTNILVAGCVAFLVIVIAMALSGAMTLRG